jgi:hypothetical protein
MINDVLQISLETQLTACMEIWGESFLGEETAAHAFRKYQVFIEPEDSLPTEQDPTLVQITL